MSIRYLKKVTEEKVKNILHTNEDDFSQVVKIRVIDINWLNKNIPEFYKYLLRNKESKIYENVLIKVLLENQSYTKQIAFYFFLP